MGLQHGLSSPRRPSRVVVMGAHGFVGGAVVARLADAGVPVLPLGRTDVDLLSPEAPAKLAALLRPDDAVVLAAARAPCKSAALLADNMLMVRGLIDALSRARVGHVVNISSDAVYADEPVPLTEETPRAPQTLHGVMHLARELALAAECSAPLAILRPSLLYGARDPHNGYGPNRFRRLAEAGQPIVLFGEGEERRDHVLVDDLSELTWRVLARRSTGTLNVATGEVHSFRAVAEMVVAAAPHKVPIVGSPRSGPMPHGGYRPFDIAATEAAFPDFGYTTLAEGIRRVQTSPGG